MQSSIQHKLNSLVDRYEEISFLLSDPETIQDQKYFRDLSREYAQLEPVACCFQEFQNALEAQKNAQLILKEEDAEMQELADEELTSIKEKIKSLEQQLQLLLLPKDPDDSKNVFLEVRAGTGGDEAAIFVGDLFRMYSRYAERQGWHAEVISSNPGEHGGYKEIIVRLSGQNVFSKLKFESGVHRVQRIPETESQGRIHTSACTVAIMPEVEDVDKVEIKADDLRIDTFRASGAGGQHVNRTDSAIRITHIPTGTVVECQDERSQHKNRARAMSVLQARLLAAERSKQQAQQAETRRNLIGSGDRSERIRTYNYPQGRVTDHRIGLTLHKLPEIMEGELTQVIEPLNQEHQADLLNAMAEDRCQ